jgi:NAD(P)-dependent dehydrogenase (short-subunit alcohol dehydrogenase family)
VKVFGKSAVVTGGASGIGLGITRALLGAGARVAITYRDEEQLREALASIRSEFLGQVLAARMEITESSDCVHAAAEIERAFGAIHILCHCAGVGSIGGWDEASADDWNRTLDVNFFGALNVLDAFLPSIRANGAVGGHIVNVASVTAFTLDPGATAYTASKFALRGLTESLRSSLEGSAIGVSLLCPGLTRSRINHSRSEGLHTRSIHAARLLALLDSVAMSADEVGVRTVRGIEQNAPWIFTHGEFNDAILHIQAELMVNLRGPGL